MKVEVKLYYYHDLDLITIYRSGSICFSRAVKMALKAFAEQKRICFQPGPQSRNLPIRRTYHFCVNLNEKEDEAAIRLLEEIAPGHRNNFLKTLLRHCIFVFPEDYFKHPEAKQTYDQMIQGMQDIPTTLCGFRRTIPSRKKKLPEAAAGTHEEVKAEKEEIKPVNETRRETNPKLQETVAEKETTSYGNRNDLISKEYEEVSRNSEEIDDITQMFMDITG